MSDAEAQIPAAIVRENVARLQELMRGEDFAAVIIFDAANMLAFTGTRHATRDRLTCAAVTCDGAVHVVCPAFERPALRTDEDLAVFHTWEEHENAYDRFAAALRQAGVSRGKLGLDGRTWISARDAFGMVLPDMQLQSADHLIRETRIIKSPAAQEHLRAAHRRGEQFFFALKELLQPGVSEIELYRTLQHRFEIEGLSVNPLIQSGPNGAIPHSRPSERRLQEGDNLVVDSVIELRGFHNDLTRTYAIGEPSPRARQAYRAVRAAQAAAIEAARPGVECRALDRIAREVIGAAGFGEFFVHRLGHGIGLECHEPPYLNGGNPELLRPGMCATIEPGVYVPGEFGVRIEDDILITEDGCEVIRGALPTDVTDAFDR